MCTQKWDDLESPRATILFLFAGPETAELQLSCHMAAVGAENYIEFGRAEGKLLVIVTGGTLIAARDFSPQFAEPFGGPRLTPELEYFIGIMALADKDPSGLESAPVVWRLTLRLNPDDAERLGTRIDIPCYYDSANQTGFMVGPRPPAE
jgi:hypothetical protein